MKQLVLSYREIAGNLPYHAATTSSEMLGGILPFHTHDFEEIFLVTKGSIMHAINGNHELLREGTLRVIRANDVHRFSLVEGSTAEFINIAFRLGYLEHHLKFTGHQSLLPQASLTGADRERIEACFKWMQSKFLEKPTIEQLGVLIANCVEVLSQPVRKPNVIDYIDLAISDLRLPLNSREGLAGLIERTSVSIPHLCRVVKRRTGRTPTKLVNSARLSHAKLILSNSNINIEEVAIEVGFNSAPYFHRVFKQEYGESPGQFRAKQRAIVGR